MLLHQQAFLALLTTATAAAQAPNFAEALIREGGPMPSFGPTSVITEIDRGQALGGLAGGWVAAVRGLDGSGAPESSFIVGQRPFQVDGPIAVLRQADTIGGYVQRVLIEPSMASGVVAYLEAPASTTSVRADSVWIEDQRIATAGDAIAGTMGWTWEYFKQVKLSLSDTALIFGEANNPGHAGTFSVLMHWPSGNVLLREEALVPGLPSPIGSLRGAPEMSPDGSHWSMVVDDDSPNRLQAAIVDGAVLEVSPGNLMLEGEPIPAALIGTSAPHSWRGFSTPMLNDLGDYVLHGDGVSLTTGTGAGATIKNGRRRSPFVTGPSLLKVLGIDRTGALLTRTLFDDTMIGLEHYQVVRGNEFLLDVDGDGVVDSGYVAEPRDVSHVAQPSTQSLSLGFVSVDYPSAPGSFMAVIRARNYRLDRPVCEGTPNSTGEACGMVAAGSSNAIRNEVNFQVYGLPVGSTGYVLLSRSFGITQNPGGSQGDLCLSGSIGRMVQQVYTAPFEGHQAVTAELTAFPQPSGSVQVLAGDTWFAQSWYRDQVAGAATSNFSSAISLTFD